MCYHLQNDIYRSNKLKIWRFFILSCSTVDSAFFLAMLPVFFFKSEFFAILKIFDLLTNLFPLIFVPDILLKLIIMKSSKIFCLNLLSYRNFCFDNSSSHTKPLAPGIFLSTLPIFVLKTAVVSKPLTSSSKPVTLGGFLSTSPTFFSKICSSVLY